MNEQPKRPVSLSDSLRHQAQYHLQQQEKCQKLAGWEGKDKNDLSRPLPPNWDKVGEIHVIEATICSKLSSIAARGFDNWFNETTQWQEATFGSRDQRGPIGTLRHLRKEVDEVIQELEKDNGTPSDLHEELADILFLLADSANRCGLNHVDLMKAAWAKLAKNQARSWPKPVDGQPCEHIKDTPCQ